MPKQNGWYFDSVTLSNFAFADALDVVTTRYAGRAFVATQVVDELARGVVAGYKELMRVLSLIDERRLENISLTAPERTTFGRLLANLGAGESGTISAAYHRNGVVVTDDAAARRASANMNIPVTGTIGILRATVRDGQCTQQHANEWLQIMIRCGFHAPVDCI